MSAMDLASRRFTWLYARSQVQLKYRYTSLGFLWNVLEPALFLGVLSLVFSVVNRMSVADYAVFLLGALHSGDELRVAHCRDCTGVLVTDRLALRTPVCNDCSGGRSGGVSEADG